jgi:hypothetical protein
MVRGASFLAGVPGDGREAGAAGSGDGVEGASGAAIGDGSSAGRVVVVFAFDVTGATHG